MAQKNVLSLDFYRRRIYTTTDSMTTVLGDAYFNPFRQELEVNEVITIVNGNRRQKIIVTQIDPYVTTDVYEDSSLRESITELQTGIQPASTEFTMTVRDNTLQADVSPLYGVTALQSFTTYDSTTTPALTDSGWVPGWPLTYTLPDWDQHTYYRYYYDGNNITQVSPNSAQSDGATTPGLILRAVDSTYPTISLAVVDGTNPGEIDYTVTYSDAESGIDTTSVIIYRSTDQVVWSPLAQNAGTSGTIANIPQGVLYYYYASVADTYGNVADDPTTAISFTAAASSGGIVSFSAVTYSQDEGTTPFTYTLQISGRTVAGDTDIVVKARAWTQGYNSSGFSSNQVNAIATLVSTGNGTDTFPDGVGTDINGTGIVINDISSDLNNVFELYIDSATNANQDPQIAPYDAGGSCLVTLNGSGGVVSQFEEPSGLKWAIDGDLATELTTVGGNQMSVTTGSEPATPDNASGHLLKMSAMSSANSTYPGYSTGGPAANYPVKWYSAGTRYVYMRIYKETGSNDDTFWLTQDGNEVFGSTYLNGGALSAASYGWIKSTTALSVTAALQTMGIVQREQRNGGVDSYIDRIVFADATGLSDATLDGYTATTLTTSGAATDNTDNPTAPLGQAPGTTVTYTDVTPSDSSTGVSVSVKVVFTYTGMNGLYVSKFLSTFQTSTGTDVSFDVTTGTDTSGNPTATFTATAALSQNTSYTITPSGVIFDTTNTLKSLTGDVTFTTANTSSFEYYRDFNDATLGPTTEAYWGGAGTTTGTVDRTNTGWGDSSFTNNANNATRVQWDVVDASTINAAVSDGLAGANSAHQKVIQITYPAGKIASQFEFGINLTPATEYYFEYEIYLPTNFEFVKGGKLPGFCSTIKPTATQVLDGTDTFAARCMWFDNGLVPAEKIINITQVVGASPATGYNVYWNDGSSGLPQKWKRGDWNQIGLHVKLNTVGSNNGIFRGYLNGVKEMDFGNITWRNSALNIDHFYFTSYYGGGDLTWAPSTTQYALLDNCRVSTSP